MTEKMAVTQPAYNPLEKRPFEKQEKKHNLGLVVSQFINC